MSYTAYLNCVNTQFPSLSMIHCKWKVLLTETCNEISLIATATVSGSQWKYYVSSLHEHSIFWYLG